MIWKMAAQNIYENFPRKNQYRRAFKVKLKTGETCNFTKNGFCLGMFY